MEPLPESISPQHYEFFRHVRGKVFQDGEFAIHEIDKAINQSFDPRFTADMVIWKGELLARLGQFEASEEALRLGILFDPTRDDAIRILQNSEGMRRSWNKFVAAVFNDCDGTGFGLARHRPRDKGVAITTEQETAAAARGGRALILRATDLVVGQCSNFPNQTLEERRRAVGISTLGPLLGSEAALRFAFSPYLTLRSFNELFGVAPFIPLMDLEMDSSPPLFIGTPPSVEATRYFQTLASEIIRFGRAAGDTASEKVESAISWFLWGLRYIVVAPVQPTKTKGPLQGQRSARPR